MASSSPSLFLPSVTDPPLPAENLPEAREISAFPDSIVQSLQAVAVGAAPSTLDAQTDLPLEKPSPRIEQPRAMQMIVDALEDFDPRLGEAARDVFKNPARLNIHEMPEGQGVMMRVRPANLTEEDVKRNKMSMDDHWDVARMRKNFPIDHNKDKDFSIIDFEYDGTINSVIYLAHELGHAIADDYQLASRHTYRDNPKHMEETQAYLVQSIVTAHLQDNPDPEIASAAKRHMADEMAGHIYAYPMAEVAATAIDMIEKGETVRPAVFFQAKLGDNWQSVAEKNYHGKKLFDALEAANTAQQAGGSPSKDVLQDLQDVIDRLHDRPTNQLVAIGIAASLQGQDQETKSKISEMVLGLYGPKDISSVMDEGGIKGPEKIKDFMEKTIKVATEPLHNEKASHSASPQSKPRPTTNITP